VEDSYAYRVVNVVAEWRNGWNLEAYQCLAVVCPFLVVEVVFAVRMMNVECRLQAMDGAFPFQMTQEAY
jgi:hypothetical protein